MTRPGMLRTLALAAALPLVLAVTACTSSGGSGAGKTASTGGQVTVGATLPLTGSLSALGAPLEAGYEQEIANVNAAGGLTIAGSKEQLKLVVLDNASDPATAAAQASQLVSKDHAAALLGPAGEQLVMPVADTAEELGVPLLTSQMPVQAFASGDKTGWTWSWDVFYSEQQQATAVATALASVPGNKRVALFTDDEPASIAERPLLQAAFKAAGLDLVGDYTFPAGTTSFSALTAEAKKAGAQLVAGELDPSDATALWTALKASGLRPQAAFLADATGTGTLPASLGPLAQDTLTEGYWSPAQASSGQLPAITATLGKKYAASSPDYSAAALAYAVAQVLTDALTKAASTSPAKLNAAIAKTSAQTTAGLITFNPTTHTATTPYYITQWQNGTLVQVQPKTAGTTLAVPAAGLG